jgi:Glycosyltransferase 61
MEKSIQDKFFSLTFLNQCHHHIICELMCILFNVTKANDIFSNSTNINTIYMSLTKPKRKCLPKVNEYLNFFKINFKLDQHEDLVSSDLFSTYFTDKMYQDIPNKEYIEYLRSFIPERNDYNFPEKILINRLPFYEDKLKTNRLLPENSVNFFLKKGYTEFYLEQLSLGAQIALFNNAKKIVAVHGAGLTNMIFCKPNTTIFELNPGCNITCYPSLSKKLFKKNNLELDYRLLLDEKYASNMNLYNTSEGENVYNSKCKNLFKIYEDKHYTILDHEYFIKSDESKLNKTCEFVNFSDEYLEKNLLDL